jgi:hypothetical protein
MKTTTRAKRPAGFAAGAGLQVLFPDHDDANVSPVVSLIAWLMGR